MKVFLSWSGGQSKELAAALRDWLPSVLQAVRSFFTPDDIDKGSRWASEIAKELEDSSMGIFCVTPSNQDSQWMNFEAGAISKKLDASHVCPVLFGLEPSDLKGPLSQFQATPFGRPEIRKLLGVMNGMLDGNKLPEPVLDSVFQKWWPDLEEAVTLIMQKPVSGMRAGRRPDRDVLDEVLEISRLLARAAKDSVTPIDARSLRLTAESLAALAGQLNYNSSENVINSLQSVCENFVKLAEPMVATRPLLVSYIETLQKLTFHADDNDIPF